MSWHLRVSDPVIRGGVAVDFNLRHACGLPWDVGQPSVGSVQAALVTCPECLATPEYAEAAS